MTDTVQRLIVGCGYLGGRIAQRWRSRGDVVCVLTRSVDHSLQFQRQGLRTHVGDILKAETLTNLPTAETVLFAVGHDRSSGASIESVYVDGFQNLLDALPPSSGPVLYTSSTGVYAQEDGEWIDEDSICEPDREGGRVCLAAEKMLLAHRRGQDAKILRLAGLYGPNRIPRSADVVAGKPLPVTGNDYLNLIHVEDATTVLLAAADQSGVRRTYNVSDGSPTTRCAYFTALARLLRAPTPRFEIVEEWSERKSGTNKRVCNDRMVRELGVRPIYPTYQEGLAAIVSEMRRQEPN